MSNHFTFHSPTPSLFSPPSTAPIAPTTPLESLAHLGLWVDIQSKLLICTQPTCRYALGSSPTCVTSHLRDKHNLPRHTRKGLSKLLRTLGLYNPTDVDPLADASPEHAKLKVYDGFACCHCPFRTIHLPTMRRHFSATSADSCPSNTPDSRRYGNIDHLFEYVYLQTWTTGSNRKYWIIKRNGHITRPVIEQHTYNHILAVQAREVACHRDGRDNQETQMTTTAAIVPNPAGLTFGEQRPWIERTGWEKTYRGKSREVLIAIASMPSWSPSGGQGHLLCRQGQGGQEGLLEDLMSPPADEQRMAGIVRLVDALMDRCEETVQKTSRNVLCWLRSTHPRSSYSKPFMLVRQPATKQTYRRQWKRVLVLIFRAYRLEPDIRERLTGIRLRKRLCRLLELLWNHPAWVTPAACSQEPIVRDSTFEDDDSDSEGEDTDKGEEVDEEVDEDEDEDEDEDDEEDDEEDEDEDDEEDEEDDEDDIFMDDGQSEDAWEPQEEEAERLYGGPAQSTAVDKKHRNEEMSEEDTETLIELLFGLSLALCTEPLVDSQPSSTILVYFSGILGFSTTTPNRTLPARIYTTHLSALLYIQRLLFLEKALPLRSYPTLGIKRRPRTMQLDRFRKIRQRYMVLGSQSAFEEFLSLRSYGRVMAQSDTPATLLNWSEDNQTVSWGEEMQLSMGQFRRLPEYLIEQASGLCGELMYGWEPTVDLTGIKDTMSNGDGGYSFVSDPRNNLGQAYLGLFRRACISRQKPLYQKGCWDGQAVGEYRKKEESFRKYLGLAMYIAGGQLPRWPELLSLWCENTEFGERGIYVHNKSLIFVTRHHKAKRSTNREFIVARFLPAEVAHLVYKYCVYIRGLINLLDRERGLASYGILRSSPLLFRAIPAPGSKPWQTSQVTRILKEATAKVWGYPVHSQLLRQLCIGITEKHVREVHQSFNRFDDTSDKAHRNVVFAWQSGHRPLQRAITYGLDGAFPTKLQPQLLDLYEWASTKWHEFLHLPSKLASLPSKETGSSHRLAWLPTAAQPAPTPASLRRKRKQNNDDQGEAGGSQATKYPVRHRRLVSQSHSTKAKTETTYK